MLGPFNSAASTNQTVLQFLQVRFVCPAIQDGFYGTHSTSMPGGAEAQERAVLRSARRPAEGERTYVA